MEWKVDKTMDNQLVLNYEHIGLHNSRPLWLLKNKKQFFSISPDDKIVFWDMTY